jgi:organic radical activating enzyme
MDIKPEQNVLQEIWQIKHVIKRRVMESINLIECINTWQGEGKLSGTRMLLCRFKYCNKKCSWCDTLVKMRAVQEAEFKISKLQEIIDNENTGLMITGGEPTFSNQLKQTINMLNNLSYPVANVETNGLDLLELIKKVDHSKNVHYSYSPKIFNEKEWETALELSEILESNLNVYMKIVYANEPLVYDFLKAVIGVFPSNRIYLMPQGKTKEEMFSNAVDVFDKAEEFKTNVSSRMHLVYDFV